MSLESIQNYCFKENFSGNTHIKCVPVDWVKDYPEFAKDGHNFSNSINLKLGRNWLLFPCAYDTIDFKERERSSSHGVRNEPSISGFLPNDTPDIASVLNSSKASEWIVILFYKTGEAKVVGSLDFPARFSSNFNNKGSLKSGKGYDIEFLSASPVKSFFTGEIPEEMEDVCLPVTVENATTAPSYSEIINSGSTLILPKENILVNGVLLKNKNSVEDFDIVLKDTNNDPVIFSIDGDDVVVDSSNSPDVVDTVNVPLDSDLIAGEIVAKDRNYNIYVNGNLDQSFTAPAFDDLTINITA